MNQESLGSTVCEGAHWVLPSLHFFFQHQAKCHPSNSCSLRCSFFCLASTGLLSRRATLAVHLSQCQRRWITVFTKKQRHISANGGGRVTTLIVWNVLHLLLLGTVIRTITLLCVFPKPSPASAALVYLAALSRVVRLHLFCSGAEPIVVACSATGTVKYSHN